MAASQDKTKEENVWILALGSASSYSSVCVCVAMVFQVCHELCYWFIQCGNLVEKKNCINNAVRDCRMVLEGKNGLHSASGEEGMTYGPLVLFAFGHRRGAAWLGLWQEPRRSS